MKTNSENGFHFELLNYQPQVDARLKQLQDENFVYRLWNNDPSLWINNNSESGDILTGWMNSADQMLNVVPMIEEFGKEIHLSGFDHVILLGMGGSSMAPMVFQKMSDASKGLPLTVLDTTDPVTIKQIRQKINISTTLFIVSSKSGTTAEVEALYNYFFDEVYQMKKRKAGENFIAITDEGSPLAKLATKKKFRNLFINFPGIGGRFSGLSYFGIIPAALMGINIKEVLERAVIMENACKENAAIYKNPGVTLGCIIAELALMGCDKLTYLVPEKLNNFGLWLEQLLAESTGKNNKGILPVNGNPLEKEITMYGKDRLFVKLAIEEEEENNIKSEIQEDFISFNHPMIYITIKDELDLAAEFFRWEIATATAGAILNVNPFDQPNVQESKKYTTRLLKEIEDNGNFPETEITLVEDSVNYYASYKEENATLLLKKFFNSVQPGDYVVLQAFLPEETKIKKYLEEIQVSLQQHLHLAVSVQFGPRYLHSTGQYHKGGPNKGFYIQFVSDAEEDVQIPNHAYTFGMLKKAQVTGDREALLKHNRNVILLDLGKSAMNGLLTFKRAIEKTDYFHKQSRKRVFTYNNVEKTVEVFFY